MSDTLIARQPKRGDNTAAWIILFGLALAVAPIVFELLGQPFYLRVLTRILIFALAASSLNLTLGVGGMVSLGHAAFVGAGSYVVGILAWHAAHEQPLLTWPFVVTGTVEPLIVWPLAVVLAALLALAVGAVSLRTSGLYFIMITLAFAQMVYYFPVSLEQYGGDDGMRLSNRPSLAGFDLADRATYYYVVLVAFAAGLWLLSRVVRSRFGLVIRAARQNPTRLKAVGLEPFGYQLTCFTISGAMAGFAGVLMANLDLFVSPADLSLTRSNELVAMILIGGTGTLWGPLLGAAFYVLAQLGLATLTTHWPLLFGPALIAIVLMAKGGLVGLLRRPS